MLSALTKIVFGFIFSIFIFVFQRFLPSSSSWIVNVESKFVISNYWEIQEVMMTMMMVLISLMNERTAIKLNEKKFFVQNPALTSAREMRTKIEKYGTFAKKKLKFSSTRTSHCASKFSCNSSSSATPAAPNS